MCSEEAIDRGDVEKLAGGNMSGVVRVGDAVRRAAGEWTPTVHRLLRHFHTRGIDWVPWPLGLTATGREVLTYLPGTVPQYPMPQWVWGEQVLLDAVARLVSFHDATRDFDTTGARWQLPTHHPAEVICHNDFAPYNLVFDDDRHVVGVIDCDTASPGPRVWDLAYLAYRLVPLNSADTPNAPAMDLDWQRRRLSLLCRTYGHNIEPSLVAQTAVQRLHDLADFTATRAAAGADHLTAHVQPYRDDAHWITTHTPDLT